jgi:multidrug efflux pump subunit AcrA (membrane-fusion protein)
MIMIKINRVLLIAVAVIAITGGILAFNFYRASSHAGAHAEKSVYYCPMHPNYTSDRPGNCPICNMTLVKRENDQPASAMKPMDGHGEPANAPKVFTVAQLMAMKPGEICLLHKCKMGTCMIAMTPEFAKLGKCPHCGEDLGVIIKDAFPQGYTQVQLGVAKQQVIGLKTAPVRKMALTKTIRASGRIAYDPELYQAEEEYLQAAQALKKAETADPEIREQAAKLVDSAKIKLRLLGLSEGIVQEVEKAGKPDRSLLYSDAGGKVWLYAPIYEYETPFVRVGDTVEVDVPAVSGKKFPGVVRSLDSVVDPVTRSLRVRSQLDNPDGILKPEMYVNVMLKTDLGEQLAVPEEAVFATGEKNIVFVTKENNIFEPREVVLGVKADRFYQVKSGLQEGEQAVISGNFLIDSESRLKFALEGAGSGDHRHDR